MIELGVYDGNSIARSSAETSLGTQNLPGGTVVSKYVRHEADISRNGYDTLDVVKKIDVAEGSKLKNLGVDCVELKKSFDCPHGSAKPFRKSTIGSGEWMTFWSGKKIGLRDHLATFDAAEVGEIKKFIKMLADMKEMKLPINSETVRGVLKLLR